MKHYALIALLWLVAVAVSGQEKQGRASAPMGKSYGGYDRTTIGYSKLRVLYAFQPKNYEDMDTWIDCGQLLSDGKMTQYSSRFLAIRDSSLVQWWKEHPRAANFPWALNLHGREKDWWSEYQYSQIFVKGDTLTEWAALPAHLETDNLIYSEPKPKFDWTLHQETKTICEYKCQKATCRWRGRDYVAWFTTDIPLRSGPWKFGGLPGLIMKIQDKTGFYNWTAVGVETGNFPIQELDRKKYVRSTRAKVWKAQYAFNFKYNLIVTRYDVRTGQQCTNVVPYEQLERE